MVTVEPNVPSVVASEVIFSIDLRHPDSEILSSCEKQIKDLVLETVSKCSADVWCIAEADTISFDEKIIETIEQEAQKLELSCRRIFSGAGHDARQMNYFCPSGMIFVPSCGGVSHNVKEYTEKSDIVAGAKVLSATLVALANQAGIK
jgi:N-carbamoyl-L-amino-acid hydrolase